MKLLKTMITVSLAISATTVLAAGPGKGSAPYEVWGADQSNSVAGAPARGVDGSYIWVWQGEDVGDQIKGKGLAVPAKYDVKDVFPASLVQVGVDGPTGKTLGDLSGFGRLHGMLADPQNKYMNINMFAPGGGYVGIVDGVTKQAIALFRVTQGNAGLAGDGRSLHMSFWNQDGSALLLANLHGRILERIDITRDADGKITNANFNIDASLNVGPELFSIDDEATAFTGPGMVSTVSGDYANADLGGMTPGGAARQGAERPNNVIICPIVSDSDNVYITFGGGGLLVADSTNTPMNITAEYDQATVNGAGCGGVQSGDYVYLNAGVSASGAGATQSTMTIYAINDSEIAAGNGGVNTPAPILVYRDTDDTDGNAANTATIGATEGDLANLTGQIPGVSTRRDAHGMAITLDGRYIHQNDRVQNVVEVIDTASMSRVGTYDLTSANGQGSGTGPCAASSVSDDPDLPVNDPAPDLMGVTPDGKYIVVANRGPAPVSVTHSAQGSCPGVGVIKLQKDGSSGKLITVLRTTNKLDDASVSAPGGHAYAGAERSDPHGASVRVRVEDMK
jgi:hypothetical protein